MLLYELIAGRPPIEGADNADTMHRVLTAEPPELHRLARQTPRDISAICSRCLEKNPKRRYASASELAADLRRFLNHEPTLARPLGPMRRAARWCRRNPLPVAVMTAVSLLLVSIAGGLAWHTTRLEAVNDRLTTATAEALAQQRRAEQSELHTRQLLYVADMRLAEKAWREGDLGSARQILDRYAPSKNDADLAGLEWHFLDRAIRPETEIVADCGSPLYFIRLSPDGNTVATAGADGVIRLHDRATGELSRSIESRQGEVNSVAFSPDGATLASAGDDGSVRLWRLSDGVQLTQFVAHDGLAFGVEFARGVSFQLADRNTASGQHTPHSDDDLCLISCGADGRVHIWQVATGERLATYHDHKNRVEAIAVSPDGHWLASVGKDMTLIVRDLRTGELYWKWSGAGGPLSSVAFSPDSKAVAIVEADGVSKRLWLLDLASHAELLSRPHLEGVRCVAFSPDGARVLTADNFGAVRIWGAASGQNRPARADETGMRSSPEPLQLRQVHDARIYSATFEPEGRSVLTAGQDGLVRRWNFGQAASEIVLDRGDLHAIAGSTFKEHHFSLHEIAFRHNGDLIVASDAGFTLIKPNSSEAPQFQLCRDHCWRRVARPRRGDWFVGASSTPKRATNSGSVHPALVERWDLPGGSWPDSPPRYPGDRHFAQRTVLYNTESNCDISALACSPLGDKLAIVVAEHPVADQPKHLLLLDAESGDVLRKFPAGGTIPRFTPDGRSLIFGVKQDIHVVDLHSDQQRVIRAAHTNNQIGMAISSEGRWLATSEGRTIKLWRLPSLEQHAVLLDHLGAVSAMAFLPDGRTLLSSSYDGTVKAWHVAAGRRLMDLHKGPVSVNHMALSADGGRLAIVEEDRRIRLYRL